MRAALRLIGVERVVVEESEAVKCSEGVGRGSLGGRWRYVGRGAARKEVR